MNNSWRQLLFAVLYTCFGTSTLCNVANAALPAAGDADSGTIVSLTNPNAHWVETVFPGSGPFALEMALHYNSRSTTYSTSAGSVGRGWSHGYSSSIFHYRSSDSGTVIVEYAIVWRGDGKNYGFTPSGGAWVGKPDAPGVLNKTSSGWTWTTRDGTVETYDSSGKLLTITGPQGLTKTLTYDSNDRLSQVASPTGQTLSFTYGASNLLSTLTDAAGRVTALNYDAKDNLVRVGYPDNTATVFHYEITYYPYLLSGVSYDNGSGTVNRDRTIGYSGTSPISEQRAGGMEKVTISRSSTWIYVTDAIGKQKRLTLTKTQNAVNVTEIRNYADNKFLTQSFDTNSNLTCKKDEEGRVTTYTYNATNQKLSQTEGKGGTCSAPVTTAETRTTTYQYLVGDLDLPTLIESPSVHAGSTKRVAISYDAQRNPAVITQSGYTPSGAAVTRTVTMTYNNGQVATIDGPRTDAPDITTLDYYNCTSGGGCGQLKSVTNALGHVTTYDSYDNSGRLLQMTDPNGVTTVYTYDPRGRVASITQTAPGGGSRVTSYGYDAAGNVILTTLPTGLSLTYTYDAAQYLRRVTDSLGNYIDYNYDLKGNRTQTNTYDASGNLVRAVDLAYDFRNRVSQLNTGGSITKQVWDALGNLTKVTDPNTSAVNGTAATTNSYDNLNRLFKTVDLLSGNTTYAYDPNDRLKTVQAPNGASTQYQYDDLGNLLKEISPDRGTVNYAYDAAGNLAQQTDARGIVSSYTYDALNRLTRIDYPGSTEDVTYTYDTGASCTFGLGRPCAVADESGSTAFAYDGFGNLALQQRTELNVVYNTRYTYDAGNRVTGITYPNGRQVNFTRNVLGNILSASMTLYGVTTPLVTGVSYRPDGLPTNRSFGNNLTDTRAYDTQGRLRELYLGSADTRLYGYDANGNLKSLQSLPLVGSYNYDVLDRLGLDQRTTTGTTSSTFTYDANGNRKTENTGSYAYLSNSNRLTSTPNGSISLDAAGNTLSDGTRSYSYNNAGQLSQVGSAGYAYNAQRQRSRKVVGSQGTVYHYDLTGNLIAETDADGNLRRDYVWADSVPVAQIEAGEKIAYLHTDHLNTPRLATNAQAQVIWRWEGTAFGDTYPNEDVDGDGKLTTVNLRFPGQYYDAESGLHYNWNRYYDPKVGRYVTSDPIGLDGGLNTYAYVGSNPLHWVDPLGLVVSGRWIKKPYAHGLNVDYRGWHFDVGDWKWIPPGLRVAIVEFYGSAVISFEVECTDDDKCDKKRWTYAPDFNVGSNFDVPVRVSISHPIITAAVIAKASYNAYKLLEHWSAIQAGYYLATDPTTWCLFSGGDSR